MVAVELCYRPSLMALACEALRRLGRDGEVDDRSRAHIGWVNQKSATLHRRERFALHHPSEAPPSHRHLTRTLGPTRRLSSRLVRCDSSTVFSSIVCDNCTLWSGQRGSSRLPLCPAHIAVFFCARQIKRNPATPRHAPAFPVASFYHTVARFSDSIRDLPLLEASFET